MPSCRGNICVLPKITWLIIFWLEVAATVVSAHAAEIAVVKSADVPYYSDAAQALRNTLAPRVAVIEYDVAGSVSRARDIAKKLRAAPPDLVVAIGLKAALAIKAEIVDTPVVFCMVLHPELNGLPTANMTGIRMIVSSAEQLAAIRSVWPAGRRLGVLYDEEPNGKFVGEARQQAAAMGIELIANAVHSRDEVPEILKTMVPTIDALWLIQDQTVVTEMSLPLFLSLGIDRKLPVFTFSSTLIRQGALAGLVVNAKEVGQQAGRMVEARLRGRKSIGESLQNPENPQLAINLRVAEHVGVTPPTEVVRHAGILYGPGALAQQPSSLNLVP